jgi:DNA modification methylase
MARVKARSPEVAAQQWPADKVSRWPIARLIPSARNARTHSDEQVAQLAASLTEWGWTTPVLVDEAGTLIAGHGRVLAARKLGWGEIPVMVASGWSDAKKRAYALADNRLPLNAGWDADLLAVELDELRDLRFDMSLMGFEPQELNDLIGTPNLGPPGLTDPDAVPDVPVEPVSRTGDLWLMGGHRLLCGDSTKAEYVARVMGGAKARVMNTDPPYGVGYDSSSLHAHGIDYGAIEGDDQLDGATLQAFLELVIRVAVPHLEDDAAFYLWHPMLTQGTFFAAAADILIHRQIIWIKPVLVFGRGDYHWKHELCFYGWRRGNRPEFYGERNQTTVWEIDSVSRSERKEFSHATPKPVELFTRPLKNHTNQGDVCYEPFTGTGPQIIAAEITGRSCYALEIAPQYIDVSVNRWQLFTGKQATLDGDGRTFEELKRERQETSPNSAETHKGQSRKEGIAAT